MKDVISRYEEDLSKITSVLGRVLCMDSTKKITRKLAGEGKDTAQWCTNVGNEDGQILVSVLTEQEGSSLNQMVDGLVDRYQ